jgi:hypothetical protein
MCDALTFRGIGRDQWTAIEAKLAIRHILVQTDIGTVKIGPADVRWGYEEDTQTLTVQCTSKPIIAPCAAVNARLTAAIREAMGA